MGKYDDIIDLPHHVSSTRPQMSMHDRAAQFSPFAALVGYDESVGEAARLTDKKAELTEDKINDLNEKIQFLRENCDEHSQIAIEYFVADKKKSGGAYHKIMGAIRRIDDYNRTLILTDGAEIPLDDIYNISFAI